MFQFSYTFYHSTTRTGNNEGNILLDDIQFYLLPELITYDTKNTTEEYAKCVNGVGVTMFTDADGKKWYFDSVLSE